MFCYKFYFDILVVKYIALHRIFTAKGIIQGVSKRALQL